MSTKIKIYASMIYLALTSLPTVFTLIGTGYGTPIAIVHFIVLTMIFLWFVLYELR